ncbi:MAG: 2,3-bisphosphoglycerate-independent phosphoglycerate mutase [Candidatus Magasanikbacteria bacterium CG_4_10_14_0_8_um_filter_32_14]|uniref:2,3-bisphosphoglycerate-independent phosphoglycerate mutase n=1 Tax=Candidatus Magasanikbacteria bacterium CG_4_10_14_0_8_um_filter_32_14 TaxID=1974640 RepID=A0A2M7R8P8_9BACT|nr:MAG: 2,3-bisphosphoglycerate-independent phosphoglycerate mutase [Candidatus Magasanikbacteria bacterium CG_4_10_14_0_8_um_filter_32_14]
MLKKLNEKKKEIVEDHKPTVLMILDGFGLADPKNTGNAITPNTAPNIFSYLKKYSNTELKACGMDVGLFPNQEGNSEAGHLNIGAGRVIEQDLVRISHAIKDGTFFKNDSFRHVLFHAKKYNSAVHLMGLLTDGQSAHANSKHIYALLEFFRKQNQKEVYLHLFTDGRDSSQHGAVNFLLDLRKNMKNGEKIATVIGRFYAMDRNKMWTRTQQAYEAVVCGIGMKANSAEDAISQAYNRDETDEYILPTVIMEGGKPVATIEDNDVIFFFNARSDRARQITKAFVQKDFQKMNQGAFKRKKIPKNNRFVAMTDFGPDLPGIFTAFPSPDFKNCLAKAIGENYEQLYISETEKYAHITYFINGGYSESINGEKRQMIKSGAHYSYADKPEMHCKEITDTVLGYLEKHTYNFVTINFPNADMVGHTGNFEATKKAVTIMDSQIKRLVDYVLNKDGQIFITADHGNAERMFDEKTGEIMTSHTTNPVPFIFISKDKKQKMKSGRLADVAPTILKVLNIEKPEEMTGHSLI